MVIDPIELIIIAYHFRFGNSNKDWRFHNLKFPLITTRTKAISTNCGCAESNLTVNKYFLL